jgi:hypothetical protein
MRCAAVISSTLVAMFMGIGTFSPASATQVPARASGSWSAHMTIYTIQPNGAFGGPGKVKEYVTCVKPGQDVARSACGRMRVVYNGSQYVTEEICVEPTGPTMYRYVYTGDFKNTFQQEYYAGSPGGKIDLIYRLTQKRVGGCQSK